MQTQTMTSQVSVAEAQSRFITKVYGWMCAALIATGLVSWYVMSSEWLLQIVATNPILLMVLLIAEVGLVVAVSAAINKLSAMQATALFFFICDFERRDSICRLSDLHIRIHCNDIFCNRRHIRRDEFLWICHKDRPDPNGQSFLYGALWSHHCVSC